MSYTGTLLTRAGQLADDAQPGFGAGPAYEPGGSLDKLASEPEVSPPAPQAPPPAPSAESSPAAKPAGEASAADSAIAAVASAFNAAIALEKKVSAPIAAIPFPSLPALRVMDIAVGIPHAHSHPPNMVPPLAPLPFPHAGPVLPIPYLSGAERTKINSVPAARCGDLGANVWCGGYIPLYEVFFGSASVWIEGARAARVGVDITKHCIFSTPRPADRPLGPFFGTTVTGSGDVFIGGAPMPSLTALAMNAAAKLAMKGGKLAIKGGAAGFRGLGKAAQKAAQKVAANRVLARLLKKGTIKIDSDDFLPLLRNLASTKVGREMLEGWEKTGHRVEYRDGRKLVAGTKDYEIFMKGPYADALDGDAGRKAAQRPPNGTGTPVPAKVVMDPTKSLDVRYGWAPPDQILAHESKHADNFGKGEAKLLENHPGDPPALYKDEHGNTYTAGKYWKNEEEFEAVMFEKDFINEMGGGPPYVNRPDYTGATAEAAEEAQKAKAKPGKTDPMPPGPSPTAGDTLPDPAGDTWPALSPPGGKPKD